MTSVLNGTTVDLGPGVDGLNLANGDNVVTTAGVENINGFEGNNTVTFIGDGAVGQSISLNGSGTNVLNLAGSSGVFGMSILGANLTVFGAGLIQHRIRVVYVHKNLTRSSQRL